MFLEQCKYFCKEVRISEHITGDIEISSADSDREDSNEENSAEENSN